MNSVMKSDLKTFEEQLRSISGGEPLTVRDIAEMTGRSESTTRRRLEQLDKKLKVFDAKPNGVGRPARTYKLRGS